MIGTAAAKDRCTTVGPKLTNPIITLPPGVLSTWKPEPTIEGEDFAVGAIWIDPSVIPGYDFADEIAPLNVKDLACPTWGLGTNTSADGTVVTTIGPPCTYISELSPHSASRPISKEIV